MAVFKCKMCGGNLDVADGMTVCECEYCGTKQTLPKSSDEQQLNMINRANHFRQQCEFDKAMEIYERMLQSNDSDAEIYWSIVLCRYGIEYVSDPLTGKKIPTCHRAQYTLITQDPDYLEALSHADEMQKEVFQREAEYIANVQKGILEISNKEEPFDVFICYKETDSDGKRTQDSVLAQELYYQLTQEGFKVFFSRITLEDKLGSAYEPYIFAALNSAKVMVVVGTKPEYFNAVWVKNEWSRYLLLMKEDHSRTMIPAYKGMDPYDLPEALSMFQAQDMSKLGFMQDLIRGIKKIAGGSKEAAPAKSSPESSSGSKADNLIKRGFMSLEDGDMQKAGSYFEEALNEDAEEAKAYVGLLLVDLNLRAESDLEGISEPFDQNSNYKKAVRFADDKLRERLTGYIETIKNRALDKTYSSANMLLNSTNFDSMKAGVESLLSIKGWRDVDDILYNTACKLSKELSPERLNLAVSILTQLPEREDAKDIIYQIGTKFENEGDTEKLKFCITVLNKISDDPRAARKIESIKFSLSDIEAQKAKKAKLEHEERINAWRINFVEGLLHLDMEHQAHTQEECTLFYGKYRTAKHRIETSGYDDDKEYSSLVEKLISAMGDLIKECDDALYTKRHKFAFFGVGFIIIAVASIMCASVQDNNITLYVLGGIAACVSILMIVLNATAKINIHSLYSYEKYTKALREISDKVRNEAFRDAELKALYEKKLGNKVDKKTDTEDVKKPDVPKKSHKKAGVIVSVICLCVAGGAIGGYFYFGRHLPLKKYNNAISLMNSGAYEEAIAAFSALGEYKDSSWLVEQCSELLQDKIEATRTIECSVGDIITVGSYEQDNDLSNGAEPIEWQVLDIKDGKALLLSRYVLDSKLFDEGMEARWSECSLRTWLNNDFMNTAFSDSQKGRISTTLVTADRNPLYSSTDPGSSVNDKMFLLSVDEVVNYFLGHSLYSDFDYYFNRSISTTDTDYAYEKNKANEEKMVYRNGREANWWLRTVGNVKSFASVATSDGSDGSIFLMGYASNYLLQGVRPAMWYVIDPKANTAYTELQCDETEQSNNAGLSIDNAKPGDIITFGSYEQDNDLSNGKEPIEWVVLENNEDNVKVISKYILDAVPYHQYNEEVQWKDSTIHEWLNNEFYNAAFSDEEKKKIQPHGELIPHYYEKTWSNVYLWDLYDMVSYYGGNVGYNENEEYYTSSKLKAEATPYALANGCENSYWWLEDTGKSQWGYSAVAVIWESAADTLVQSYFCGARPVISLLKG